MDDDGAERRSRRARGERLETRLAGTHACQPVRPASVVPVVPVPRGVDVRLPRPGGDVRQERGKVVRRERRVAVAERVEPRRRAVREPAAERRLDGVRRPDAPREGELRRGGSLAVTTHAR